jgi:hypothetical protein
MMMMGMSPKTQKDLILVKNKTSSTIQNNYKLFTQSPSVNYNLSNLYYSSNNSISSVNLHDNSNSTIGIHKNNNNNNTSIMSNDKIDVIKSKRFTQSRRSSVTNSIAYSLTEDGDESSSSSSYKLDHIPSSPIGMDFRVGFSIQNLTGQPVRYLQEWEGSRRTVQYLNHNERGLLNFVASKSVIRNNIAIEETFDVQLEHNTLRGNCYSASSNINSNSSRKTRRGNSVALQISGYKWLSSIQADVLGVNYQELDTVVGKIKPSFVCKNWRIDNALKLMVEVVPFCGGRMLKLSSVFKIKNNTKHKLKILAKEGFSSSFLSTSASASNRGNYMTYSTSTAAAGGIVEVGDEKDIPFYLDAGDLFHIPIPLLRRSALSSQGKSLGYLYLQPYDISPIEEELLFRPNCNVGSVEYTTDPINLFQTIQRSYDIIDSNNTMNNNSNGNSGSIKMNSDSYVSSSSTKDRFFQLICPIHPRAINKRSPSQRASGLNSNQHHQKQQHQQQHSLQQSYQQQQQQQNDNITDYDRHEFMSRSSSVVGSNKLPPFCYCIEVQKDQVSSSDVQKEMLPTSLSRFFYNQRDHHGISSPSNFTISSYYYYC